MDISICICTCRIGGVDMVAEGFANQNFKGSAELVISDELAHLRSEIVKEYLDFFSFKYKHVKAENWPFPCVPSTVNKGVKKASGRYLVLMGDYTYPDKDFLSKAYNLIAKHKNSIIFFEVATYPFPEIDMPLSMDKHAISIFKNGFKPKFERHIYSTKT